MTDATTEFFHSWRRVGTNRCWRRPRARSASTSANGGARAERWLITIDKGDVAVSHKNAKADCVVRADRALFDGIASGEANAMAAFLRGAVEIDGDRGLLLAFQRAFPGPPRKGA